MLLKSEHFNNKAVVLSESGAIKATLTYKDAHEISGAVRKFLSIHVLDKFVCVGLRMDHNIYIPSIILSLQDLQLPFMFLPADKNDELRVINDLGVAWVLSFANIPENTIAASLRINSESLFLVKYDVPSRTHENIFYIIRTSGTTGDNKYVKVSKRSIESNVESLSDIFRITKSDVIYFGTPLTFDPSMVELGLALNNGACLLIANKSDPCALFHPDNGITVLQIVPSLFAAWFQHCLDTILLESRLRILAFGGETFPRHILSRKRSKKLRIFNLYGITEVSCWASVCEALNTDSVPIGDPLPETCIEVRDVHNCPISEGEGEIYIGSTSRICLVGDEVAAPNFRATGDIARIKDKQIFYKCRKNDVFKRLGHKLRLSRIEEMVRTETGLDCKCLWFKPDSKLLLFVAVENCDNIREKVLDKLRVKLLHSLPPWCFPDYIDAVSKFPVTGHGKTDKKALEGVFLKRKLGESHIFESLVCKYLGCESDGLQNFMDLTFFESGGNSIRAVQLVGAFRDATGGVPDELLGALFEKPLKECFNSVKNMKATKRTTQQMVQHTAKKLKLGLKLKVKWRFDLKACVDASPLVFYSSDRLLAAVGSFAHIFAVVDAITGEVSTQYVLPDAVESSPSQSPCEKYLFVGCFDGKLYCLSVEQEEIKWSYLTADRIKCKPVLCRGGTAVVFGSYDKHIHCVDVAEGHTVWKSHVFEAVVSSPIVVAGRIFVATICGSCVGLSESTGEILWTYKMGSPVFGGGCCLGDLLLWPAVEGRIVCLTLDGEYQWTYECQGHLFSSLVAYGKLVIFGCHDQNLYVLEIGDGGLFVKLVVNVGDNISATPCPCDVKGESCIVVATNSGMLWVVNFEGFIVGELRLPCEVFSSVAVHSGRIYVGCRDNNLHCVDVE